MTKRPVAIITDSTANIPDDLIARHNIEVIPQILNWAGESYRDGVDISHTAFYDRLPQDSASPSTSQPSVGEFVEFFGEVGKRAEEIVAILVSDELSGTIGSARGALEFGLDVPVHVLDSRSVSMGLGLIVLAAARAAEEGKSAEGIMALAQSLVSRVNVIFVVDTLEYLHRGGRIGGAQRLVGTVLAMKPVLQIEGGKVEPLKSVRTKKKALAFALDYVRQSMQGEDRVHLAVLHANAEEAAAEVLSELEASLMPLSSLVTLVSPVIGTHAGPGTIGIAWYAEA
jgi:DegV family protein with EDD domain